MTSERATRANRRNAEASTGPRSAEGKARSRQNALKHGLSAVDPNPEAEADIEQLASLIAGEHASNLKILQAAWAVAAAQSQLQRVKAFKFSLLRTEAVLQVSEGGREGLPHLLISSNLFQRLEALERYERRAYARRKVAARGFNELLKRAARILTQPESPSENSG